MTTARKQPPVKRVKDGKRPVRPEVRADNPVAGAVRAAEHLEMEAVRFLRVDARTTHHAFGELPQDVSADIGFTRPEYERSPDRLRVWTTLFFKLKAKQPNSAGTSFVSVCATTELLYLVRDPDTLPDADLRAFTQMNVPFNAWPFWREIVMSSMQRLGVPPVAIPFFSHLRHSKIHAE